LQDKFFDKNYTYFIILFVLCVSCLVIYRIGDNHYKDGIAAEKRGDLAAALKHLQEAENYRPLDSKCYIACANVYKKLAEIYKENAKATSDKDGEISLTADEYYADAMSDYNMAIKLKPKRAEYYYARGLCSLTADSGQAINDFNKAIKLGMKDIKVYYSRGCSYYNKIDYKPAIQDFSKVINAKPDFAEAYYYRGVSYFYVYNSSKSKSDDIKAMSDLNIAVKLNPSYSQAYLKRAEVYRNRKDYASATADLIKYKTLSSR